MKTVDIVPATEADFAELVANAKEDGHAVYFPNWIYKKEGRIVGYYSTAVPMVLSWQDKARVKAIDSIKILGHIEGSVQSRLVVIPCDPESPYNSWLPSQGYENYFKPVNLFLKRR
jgi:hypothetical protein